MRFGLKLRKNNLEKKNINEILYKNKRIKFKIDFIYTLMKLFGII